MTTATLPATLAFFRNKARSLRRRMTSTKRETSPGRIADFLIDRFTPLGVAITPANRGLIEQEIRWAVLGKASAIVDQVQRWAVTRTTEVRQTAGAGFAAPSRLSDLIRILAKSEFKSVREFASFCTLSESADREIDDADFQRSVGVSIVDGFAMASVAAATISYKVAGRVAHSLLLVAGAVSLVVMFPIFAALFSLKEMPEYLSSLHGALGLTMSRLHFLADSGVILSACYAAIFIGVIRFLAAELFSSSK